MKATSKVALLLVLSGLALRVFFAGQFAFGHSGGELAIAVAVVGCLIRISALIPQIANKSKRGSHLFLPALVLAHLLAASLGGRVRYVTSGALAAFELALLARAAWLWKIARHARVAGEYAEDTLERVASAFLPAPLARMLSLEAVILCSCLYGIGRGFRLPVQDGFSYVENSLFRYVPLLLLMTAPGEVLLLRVVFGKTELVRIALLVAHIWAIMWVYGVYVTMRLRPHVIAQNGIFLNRGILARAYVPRGCIANCVPRAGEEDATVQHKSNEKRVKLVVQGPGVVDLDLSAPVTVRRSISGNAETQHIRISADAPGEFCAVLMCNHAETSLETSA